MATATVNSTVRQQPVAGPKISPARSFTLHLWCFVLPLVNMAFLLTGPHLWWVALLWIAPIVVLVMVDNRAPNDKRQPVPTANWPFDLQVYLLTAIQVANHGLLGFMAMKISIWPLSDLGTAAANLVPVAVLCGTTAGYSGIVVAHEWIHRRKKHQFFLGRLLLAMVLYEHFSTEHIRGHHPRIGTAGDPATARFGETLRQFFLRTVPAQFKSAWRLEKVRNDLDGVSALSPKWLRHRVLQGVIGQVLLLVAFTYFFGFVALFFFLIQARGAITLLETVNYIEHWGLTRVGNRVTAEDSWDTDNWFTLHTLVGLSRHADHHAQASRPYHQLRCFEQSPKMPRGYYGTIVMALMNNRGYMEAATKELRDRKLGPFREELASPPPPPSPAAIGAGSAPENAPGLAAS